MLAEEIVHGPAVRVSPEAYDRMLDVLDNPGEPNDRLRDAFARYRELFDE
jgi:uncharacterized protein (DUF1778 family)